MLEQIRFFISDLKRWNCASPKDVFYIIFERAVWGLMFYRFSRALFLINIPIVKIFLRLLAFFIYKFSDMFLGVSIPAGANIGPGLYIGHAGLVMVNEEAVIGKNLSIGPGVLIGLRGAGQKGAPQIGDDVYVGVGAKILGNVKVGSNVRIGANSVVVYNVPNNVVMFGVPAKIVGPVLPLKKG